MIRNIQMQKIIINDKVYVSDKPIIKTIHGKTGEVVIGGFYEGSKKDCEYGTKCLWDCETFCNRCAEEIGDDRR